MIKNFLLNNLKLTINNAPVAFNNYLFRVVVSGTCGVPIYSSFAVLHVINPPSPTLDPTNQEICEQANVYLIAGGFGVPEFKEKTILPA